MKKMLLRAIAICLVAVVMFTVTGCKTKVLHCDNCNKEVKVAEKSEMEEEWTIFCKECNEKLFGDDPLLGTGK